MAKRNPLRENETTCEYRRRIGAKGVERRLVFEPFKGYILRVEAQQGLADCDCAAWNYMKRLTAFPRSTLSKR
jgi:hypothetical protein